MALTVVVRSTDASREAKLSFDAPRVVIGRAASCDVRLPDVSVSQRHASIRHRGPEYVLVDENSSNGTFVGQSQLSPQAPRALKNGALIRIGRVWLEIKIEATIVPTNQTVATKDLALQLIADSLTSQGLSVTPYIEVTEGPDQALRFELAEDKSQWVVGRATHADCTLADQDVSREHLELTRTLNASKERWCIRDLGSKNGVQVGETVLGPKKESPWDPKLALQLGTTTIRYRDPVGIALAELESATDELLVADSVPPQISSGSVESASSLPRPPTSVRPASGHPHPTRTSSLAGDMLVAALALVVLGVSAVGLYWVFVFGR